MLSKLKYCILNNVPMPTVSPHRTACMTAVTVRKVRTACVLQCPPMSMPVQWQESISPAGGRPSVVSKDHFVLLW